MNEPEGQNRSPIIGDLNLPPQRTAGDAGSGSVDPDEKVPALIELNVNYPGGLVAVRQAFYSLWEREFMERAGGSWPEHPPPGVDQPSVPEGLQYIAPKLYQCVLSRADLREMVEQDQRSARSTTVPPVIFRVWPDYPLEPQIDRSAPTVKADAAWRSYDARGHGIVWAVIDSGIDASHPHFSRVGTRRGGPRGRPAAGADQQAAPRFQLPGEPRQPVEASRAGDQAGPAPVGPPPSALVDESGHGTHVAGIISGCTPEEGKPRVAVSKDPQDGGFVQRTRVGKLSGMAPACELVSLKVMRLSGQGQWVTSFSAVIRALTYLRTEVNADPAVLRVHGVNMSLGCEWHPEHYAAGQSPLCQALNQLVATGVVVVVSAGNFGARTTRGESVNTSAVLGSITEPAHAEDCIAVGSTHREAPHAFGVTWTSSKGPTLDGRMKPDVVAPGSGSPLPPPVRSAPGPVWTRPTETPAGRTGRPMGTRLTYAEQSGTSMAAPHVSGVIAAFLSARPEFIGRPRQVKRLLTQSATDLGRERYAQGAGLVDLMRMLANV